MSDLTDIAIKIGLSALLSGAVGIEREWTGKWAGMRTHMLIAVGSTLFTMISSRPAASGGIGDAGRIAAQVVTGVGFIGAGTILQSRGAVHGLTTAAGLWVAAAVGVAVGAGSFSAAIFTTVALLVILAALRPVERLLVRSHLRTVVLHLERGQKVAQVLDAVEECALETEAIEVSRTAGRPQVTVRMRGSAEDARRLLQTASLQGLQGTDETEPRPAPFPP
jgi:putative Mg2+ transporter-C (MgtC) family protein